MKIQTKDLTGTALDWAVAKCEGREGVVCKNPSWAVPVYIATNDTGLYTYAPTTDWAQGGPIIDREHITVGPHVHSPAAVILGAWKGISLIQTTASMYTKKTAPHHSSQPCAAIASAQGFRDGVASLSAAEPAPALTQGAAIAAGAAERTGCTAGTDEECTRRGCATNCHALRPSHVWRATALDAMTHLGHQSAARAMGQETKQHPQPSPSSGAFLLPDEQELTHNPTGTKAGVSHHGKPSRGG